MKSTGLFIVLCAVSAALPWLPSTSTPVSNSTAREFPGWPAEWEGERLEPLPLSSREERFAAGFPGRIGRFRTGSRQIILRWVTIETRTLHPAADCFRGSGYAVTSLGIQTERDGLKWGCFQAVSATERLRVCERVFDQTGMSWTDISWWYWAAALGESRGPWWAATVAEDIR